MLEGVLGIDVSVWICKFYLNITCHYSSIIPICLGHLHRWKYHRHQILLALEYLIIVGYDGYIVSIVKV